MREGAGNRNENDTCIRIVSHRRIRIVSESQMRKNSDHKILLLVVKATIAIFNLELKSIHQTLILGKMASETIDFLRLEKSRTRETVH